MPNDEYRLLNPFGVRSGDALKAHANENPAVPLDAVVDLVDVALFGDAVQIPRCICVIHKRKYVRGCASAA